MSKADQIRAMDDAPARDVAVALGVSKKHVWAVRWCDANPEHARRIGSEQQKRWRANNPEKARALKRRTYHRNKKLGGIGHPTWSREHTMLLIMLHAAGKTFSEIAAEMDVSRSTVAGRLKRLRDAGEIT